METRAVILADPTLNERQKQVLLQIYESFRKENGFEITPDLAQNVTQDVQDEAQGISKAHRAPSKRRTPPIRAPPADGSDADPQQTAS